MCQNDLTQFPKDRADYPCDYRVDNIEVVRE